MVVVVVVVTTVVCVAGAKDNWATKSCLPTCGSNPPFLLRGRGVWEICPLPLVCGRFSMAVSSSILTMMGDVSPGTNRGCGVLG